MRSKHNPGRVLKFAALALAIACAFSQAGLAATYVKIPDPGLAAAIRRELYVRSEDVSTFDLDLLTELRDYGNIIKDLTGLERARYLRELRIWDNQISDLSPLAGLTRLRRLELPGNRIIDLSPLAGLTALETLLIWDNQISDLSPLAGLTRLGYLHLDGNRIIDLKPLTGLTDLSRISLIRNQISDITPLAGLTNLRMLELGDNLIVDLSPLAGLTNLWWLRLDNNMISELSPLTELTSLRHLWLHNNQISDIGPLAGLTNLFFKCMYGFCYPGLSIEHNYIDINPGSPARQVIDSFNAVEGRTVTYEPQKDPEPLMGGVTIDGLDDWYQSNWWGTYCTTFAPWLFHAEHGFLYRDPSSTNESMYVYDDAMAAWCWTSDDVYPFIYAFNPPADNGGTDVEDTWLFYFGGTGEPRSFGVVTGESAGQTLFFDPGWASN